MEQEQSYFEVMEELGQMNIFDVMPAEQEVQEMHVAVGDKVRCIVTEESDATAYNYFKYYYPQVLTSAGEVVDIVKNILHVRFKNDVVQLKLHEIEA